MTRIDPIIRQLKIAKTDSERQALNKALRQEISKNAKIREYIKKSQKNISTATDNSNRTAIQKSISWNRTATMGLSISLFRNAGTIKDSLLGEQEWQKVLHDISRDAAGYGASIKIVDSLIVQTADKVAVLSWLPKASQQMGGAVMLGIFMFDSVKVSFSYMQGNIKIGEFYEEFVENGKQSFQAAISASIALAIVPTNAPIIVAVMLPLGAAIVIDKGIKHLISHMNYGDMTIEDIEKIFQVSFDGYFSSYESQKYDIAWKNEEGKDIWGTKKYQTTFGDLKYDTHWR